MNRIKNVQKLYIELSVQKCITMVLVQTGEQIGLDLQGKLMHRCFKCRVEQVSNQKLVAQLLREKCMSLILFLCQITSTLGSNHMSALQFRNTLINV